MLANGIKLGYAESGSSYTNLEGLQEVPEIGSEPEKVDVTTLADKAKKYEQGIGDYGDLVSVKIGGGGVNALITFTVSMALQSDVEIENPAELV